MERLYLNDGSFEHIYDDGDFQRLIYERLGYDAEKVIKKLISRADYTKQKINTDLTAYESELESNRTAFTDINDALHEMFSYILKCKRLNKDNLLESIKQIQSIINNQI